MTITYWPDSALRAALAAATISTTSQTSHGFRPMERTIVIVEYGSGTGLESGARISRKPCLLVTNLEIQSAQISR